jgi:hypothetical protein
MEELKDFLKLDREVKFTVINLTRLRSLVKNFANEEKFLQYMLQVFDKKLKSKIKLKLKK